MRKDGCFNTLRAGFTGIMLALCLVLTGCPDEKKDKDATAEPDVIADVAGDVAPEIEGDTGDPCDPDPCQSPIPAAVCDDDGVTLKWAGQGSCEVNEEGVGECVYPEGTTDCSVEGQVCKDGECVDPVIDPCDPDPCTVTPPDLFCEDDGVTLSWSTGPGTCSVNEEGEAECEYGTESEDCSADGQVCKDGACVTEGGPCDPNPCTEPPADYCEDDAATAVTHEDTGTCDDATGEAVCEYQETSTNCADEGKICLEGECVEITDPCDPNPCIDVPPDYCEDDATAIQYSGTDGVCGVTVDGETTCDYPNQPVDCAGDGKVCQNGECADPGCNSHCDCDQGWSCNDGECALADPLVFCCGQEGCPENETCFNAAGDQGLCGVETSSAFGKVLFNEVLTDGSTDIDPNGGEDSGDAVEDEFIELVNAGDAPIDIGGFTIVELTVPAVPRHTFADGTVLQPGKAAVVFGGGDAPDATDGAVFFTANAEDPALPFGLSLNNDGDAVKLLDADGKLVAEFNYGGDTGVEPAFDESLTRSPDLTGEFVPHSQAAGAAGAIFSPGAKADGTTF